MGIAVRRTLLTREGDTDGGRQSGVDTYQEMTVRASIRGHALLLTV